MPEKATFWQVDFSEDGVSMNNTHRLHKCLHTLYTYFTQIYNIPVVSGNRLCKLCFSGAKCFLQLSFTVAKLERYNTATKTSRFYRTKQTVSGHLENWEWCKNNTEGIELITVSLLSSPVQSSMCCAWRTSQTRAPSKRQVLLLQHVANHWF